MLIDFTECIGCGECVKACQQANDLPSEPDLTDLSARNYTVVLQKEKQYYRKLCMHCQEPTCASVCPVGAFTKTEQGPVLYDASKCMGCRYCMMACPFGVPRYEWNSAIPVVKKCIFCAHRLAEGQESACAWVCPMGATRMGTRSHLLEIAKSRIERHPEKYVNYVYGEMDAGGTSMMLLSGVPFEELGYRMDLQKEPMPALTWQVLNKIPSIVLTGGVLLGGLSWIINRRIQIEAGELTEDELTGDRKKEAGDE
jgi:formate dehydrogenase iron-sulfur subunit